MRPQITANRAVARFQDGREYLVCDAVMIRPGVLSANNGAILYPGKVLRDRPGRWDGVPLTLNHPTDGRGRAISAKAPEARRFVIGRVDGVRYAGGGLRGEAWFDVERTDAGVLERIDGGGPLEVSTGLFTDTVSVGGVYAGRRYEKRLTGFTPDHLAVLEHEIGACSVRDGCGLVANAACGCGGGGTCRGGCGGIDIPPHEEPPMDLPRIW